MKSSTDTLMPSDGGKSTQVYNLIILSKNGNKTLQTRTDCYDRLS